MTLPTRFTLKSSTVLLGRRTRPKNTWWARRISQNAKVFILKVGIQQSRNLRTHLEKQNTEDNSYFTQKSSAFTGWRGMLDTMSSFLSWTLRAGQLQVGISYHPSADCLFLCGCFPERCCSNYYGRRKLVRMTPLTSKVNFRGGIFNLYCGIMGHLSSKMSASKRHKIGEL